MNRTDLICLNRHFKSTGLYRSFIKAPLGFVDAGTSGGIHPVIVPAASLTHCICFEPDRKAAREIELKYSKTCPFAKLTVHRLALGSCSEERKLFLTRSPVNTSLLEPIPELAARYNVQGFIKKGFIKVRTETLDNILSNKRARCAEFIKLDCQGAEHEILKGAEKLLDEQCVALLCEVEFFRMYKKQKTFSELDIFLRKRGFQLYGLYPNYISAKKLDRRKFETEERIIWADAVYFKDPLAPENFERKFSQRNIEALFFCSLLTKYYDFALELAEKYLSTDLKELKSLVRDLATRNRKSIESDFSNLLKKNGEISFLSIKKFIDRNKSNNSVDFFTENDHS